MEPEPPPTSHSSSPGAGASAHRVAARTCRLVSWPSCSYAASGRPGVAPSRGAAGGVAAAVEGDDVEGVARRVLPPLGRAFVRVLVLGAEPLQHPHPARAEAAPAQQGGDLARAARSGAQHQHPPALVQGGREPGHRAADHGHHLGVLHRPAQAGAGVGDGGGVRVHQQGFGAELLAEGAADPVEHRVPAGQHHDPAARVLGHQLRYGRAQRARPGHAQPGARIGRQQVQLPGPADQHLGGGQRGTGAGAEPGPAVGAEADHRHGGGGCCGAHGEVPRGREKGARGGRLRSLPPPPPPPGSQGDLRNPGGGDPGAAAPRPGPRPPPGGG